MRLFVDWQIYLGSVSTLVMIAYLMYGGVIAGSAFFWGMLVGGIVLGIYRLVKGRIKKSKSNNQSPLG